MRIANLRTLLRAIPLALATTLIAGCAAQRPADQAPATARIKPLNPADYPRYKTFSGPGEAASELVRVFEPRIVSFGEFHNELGGDFRSASARFGEEILPRLRDAGFTELVTEFAPDNGEAAIELTRLSHGGRVGPASTPTLFRWAQGSDEAGILSIYRNAGPLRIYGSNTEIDPSAAQPARRAELIGRQTREIAAVLLEDGRKVITYNGIYHNDITAYRGNEEISFGRYFNQRYSYLEIDLILPEMMDGFPMGEQEITRYRPLVPEKGLTVYREAPRKFVFIFARST